MNVVEELRANAYAVAVLAVDASENNLAFERPENKKSECDWSY